jgi:hypothetical protein
VSDCSRAVPGARAGAGSRISARTAEAVTHHHGEHRRHRSDFIARLIARKLTESARINAIVENRPSVNGIVAAQ